MKMKGITTVKDHIHAVNAPSEPGGGEFTWQTPYLCFLAAYSLTLRSPSSPPRAPCRGPCRCSSCRGGGSTPGQGRSDHWTCRSSSGQTWEAWSRPSRGSRGTGSRRSPGPAPRSHCRQCRRWREPSWPWSDSDSGSHSWRGRGARQTLLTSLRQTWR